MPFAQPFLLRCRSTLPFHYLPNQPPTTTMQPTGKSATVSELIAAANRIILGKDTQIRLSLAVSVN